MKSLNQVMKSWFKQDPNSMLSAFLRVYGTRESSHSESGCCQDMLSSGNEMMQKTINKKKRSQRNDLLKNDRMENSCE